MAVVAFVVGLVVALVIVGDDLRLVIHQVGGRGHRLDRQELGIAVVAGRGGAQVVGRRLRIESLDHAVDRLGIGLDRFVIAGVGQVDDRVLRPV